MRGYRGRLLTELAEKEAATAHGPSCCPASARPPNFRRVSPVDPEHQDNNPAETAPRQDIICAYMSSPQASESTEVFKDYIDISCRLIDPLKATSRCGLVLFQGFFGNMVREPYSHVVAKAGLKDQMPENNRGLRGISRLLLPIDRSSDDYNGLCSRVQFLCRHESLDLSHAAFGRLLNLQKHQEHLHTLEDLH